MEGPQANDDPPPSTFAAQIVQNLTSHGRRSGRGTGPSHLRQLLQQILDGDRSDDPQAGTIETDLDVNFRLIYVIVRAGLEILSSPNPFDDEEGIRSQALDCLAVISLTIKRSPKVLFHVPSPHEPDVGPKGPLFLWLIPQLISLLRPNSEERLLDAAMTVLKRALVARSGSLILKSRTNPVLKYIRGCINDLMLFVEAPKRPEHEAAVVQPFHVPTTGTILDVLPHFVQENHLQIASTIDHQDVFHDLSMVLYSLRAILTSRTQPKVDFTKTASRDIEWTIDFLTRLKPTVESVGLSRNNAPLCLLFLLVLHDALSVASTVQNNLAPCLRVTTLLCCCIGYLVELHHENLSQALLHEMCLVLCDILVIGYSSVLSLQAVHEQLYTALSDLQRSYHGLGDVGSDLQHVVDVSLSLIGDDLVPGCSTTSKLQVPSFTNSDVKERFDLVIASVGALVVSDEDHRPSKRTRIHIPESKASTLSQPEQMFNQLYNLLRISPRTDFAETSSRASAIPEGLSLEDISAAFSTIGEIPCLYGETAALLSNMCSACDGDMRELSELSYMDEMRCEELMIIVMRLLDLPHVPSSDRPRITAMTAIRHLCMHTRNAKHLDLSVSPLGQWCLHALGSALRELRLAAGRTLSVFVRHGLDPKFLRQNRITALNHLRTLSLKNELALQETCVIAWGQMAQSCDEDETNIVLLHLVEYLGHTNSLISGLAYDELLRLSHHSSVQARKLFEPFWRTVAITVVKALQNRPQIAQQMSDLLGIDVKAFLRLTQPFTVPYLVLTKRKDILQRIADARAPPYSSVASLCMDRGNIPNILAYLLLHTAANDWEITILSLLREVSPNFASVDLVEIVKIESLLTVIELLKAAGEAEDDKDGQAYEALEFLVNHHHRGSSSKGPKQKRDAVGSFFEEYILAIVSLLSDTFDNSKGESTTSEKKRCLGAFRELIKIGKAHISSALPQISACIRSTIEMEELCDDAFCAWMPLLDSLSKDDIESLVVPTFALLAQHWDSFQPKTQKRAYETVSRLLKNNSSMIRDIVSRIPSLASIPLMSKFEEELGKIKAQMDSKHQLQAFIERCENENATAVTRSLAELEMYLMNNQELIHTLATSEQPDDVLSNLTRSVLDACVRFNTTNSEIALLCAKCLGLIGCLDSTKIEAVKDSREIFVLNNFGTHDEIVEFVVFFFEEVLVKVFLSTTQSKSQGILAYAIQELLRVTGFDSSGTFRNVDDSAKYHRWISIPESVRNILSPYLTSRYVLSAASFQECVYPIYRTGLKHDKWLRDFVFDLLQKAAGENTSLVFDIFKRVVRNQDIVIAKFLFPFAVLNVVVSGTKQQQHDTSHEIYRVLTHSLPDTNQGGREDLISCSLDIFQTLDYMSRWMQEKKREVNRRNALATRSGRSSSEAEQTMALDQISLVESFLSAIPAEVLSRRAVECRSFARALYYWEQYIREQKVRPAITDEELEPLYERLQDIYTQIDEPDGIEGISSHLHVLNIDQQVLEHRKAGRWNAVQSWYELVLQEKPEDTEVQFSLLTSLKESGQHDALLNQIGEFPHTDTSRTMSRPFAVASAWTTGKWERLTHYLAGDSLELSANFNVGIASALQALRTREYQRSSEIIDKLRSDTARTMSANTTTSLQACHDTMLKFHVITEVEIISGLHDLETQDRPALLESLDRRLEVFGAFLSDKQYSLGLRRAAMQLSRYEFSNLEISSTWLVSARLARKSSSTHQAFDAVLRASKLGDTSATIEHSKLLWNEGHHRKAIQSLEGAILANAFHSHDYIDNGVDPAVREPTQQQQQNLVTARAHLLLAKWIDRAGQTQSDVIIKRYKKAVEFHNRWEKGHYYLGKHYNKLLESERAKPLAKQAQTYISGETAKLVIENYLRSLAYGAKYIYQTLPRILTLWLGLGIDVDKPLNPGYGDDDNFRQHTVAQRRKLFDTVTRQVKKYIDRLPAFIFYTALPQIVARICHPNFMVNASLIDIIAKVVGAHPQQATWTLLAVVKSSNRERSNKGIACVTKILDNARKLKGEQSVSDLQNVIQQGQKLSDQLLRICEGHIEPKQNGVSITRDLGFVHKKGGYRLVIPLESTMTASLPVVTENVNMKAHKAFSKDTITISTFLDDVLVLNSLARPRKVSVKGSDGRTYGLLCKPKDDLRKDQRLMEFNAMINRSLKKDAESSKRRLYIKTYAVTPLNEECGLIEWVDNLKTFRDILLSIYKQRSIFVDYARVRVLLDEACSDEKKVSIFTKEVLSIFPPVFHEWFVDMFPEPGAWFTARLRYTRSCAVMSIVGHVLGLGDRHTENILFEEGNGGTFHVDFNCLFDKGLTFDKPELVPFRLTHNMIDAFGAYGYEGPFRKSCELTLEILRQNEDTLMTILETFLYDPTTDFIGKKKRTARNVPDTPEGVLESVRNKVRGLLPMESVPLSVEGYVHELISQAADPKRLCAMYIGWCAFF